MSWKADTNIEMLDEINRIEREWKEATSCGLTCCGGDFSCNGWCHMNMSHLCVYVKRAREFVYGQTEEGKPIF